MTPHWHALALRIAILAVFAASLGAQGGHSAEDRREMPVAYSGTTTAPDTSSQQCPKWAPFNRTVPAMWFGGPLPETPSALATISKYAVAVMSSEGTLSVQQCAALKQIAPSLVCLTYRQTAVAWPLDPPFSTAVPAPAHSGWWLRADNGSRWLSPAYMWDWRNDSLRQWYLDTATASLIHEHPAVDGAFFDDFDGAVCPFESAYAELPSRYTAADRVAMHNAKMSLFGRVAPAMCAGGQLAVFAMAATFGDAGVPAEYRCAVNESATLHQLGAAAAGSFARYRIWPRLEQLNEAKCTFLMLEMLRERQAQIEQFFYTIVERGEALSDVPVAAFLLVRGPRSMFGASAGWVDADWSWHPQFDLDIGSPLDSVASVVNGTVFRRRYTRGEVTLNCSTQTATILPDVNTP